MIATAKIRRFLFENYTIDDEDDLDNDDSFLEKGDDRFLAGNVGSLEHLYPSIQ